MIKSAVKPTKAKSATLFKDGIRLTVQQYPKPTLYIGRDGCKLDRVSLNSIPEPALAIECILDSLVTNEYLLKSHRLQGSELLKEDPTRGISLPIAINSKSKLLNFIKEELATIAKFREICETESHSTASNNGR